MRQRLRSDLLFLLIWLPSLALAGSPPALIDAEWLKRNLDSDALVVLDIQPEPSYRRYHIPGAVNAPYEQWRTRKMMPTVAQLEQMLGQIGISANDHVVIVATGRDVNDLSAAARVFWSLKVLGHARASVLDGGLVAYARARGPLANGREMRAATKYSASPRLEMMPNADAVMSAIEAGVQSIDSRSEGEFVGLYGGGEKARAGTIPSALNLPHDWIAENRSANLRDSGALRQLFLARGVDPDGEQIHFCASGNRASLTWFAAYAVLGNEKARLYDGSMNEWAVRTDLPIETKIKLCSAC